MSDLRDYPKPLVPRDIAVQIRSYVRMQWPHIDPPAGGALWDVPADCSTRTFVLLDGEQLISHAEANFRTLDHAGERFIIGGLSTVFTYPARRDSGCARQVVRAATAYLDHSHADLAMLFCGRALQPLYGRFGWEPMEGARIVYGAPGGSRRDEVGLVMMRFISARGRAARAAFASVPIYVGERTW